VQTNLQSLSPTQFVFVLPSAASINHLVVFLLPGTVLPETHAATVHIRFPSRGSFQLLGAISAAKPSAIFRVRAMAGDAQSLADGEVTLGISVEDVASVDAQLASLPSVPAPPLPHLEGALVRAGRSVDTLLLAQRVIGNAFNYLGSFSIAVQGEEVVPLKAFREWWVKFEKKVEYDPTFLERETE